jgi:hypothetical protein
MSLLPFSTEAFFAVFEQYNLAIWPAQVLAYILGLAVVVLMLKPVRHGDRVIAAILAVAWIGMGAGYHMSYFAAINPVALVFGAAFVVQGALFAWIGVVRDRLRFRFAPDLVGWAGLGLMAFAMAVYPLLGLAAGHAWPAAPMFGVAPCPTTIFTIGALVLGRAGLALMAIPLVWAVIGTTAAVLLDVPQDVSLAIAGAVGLALTVLRRRPVAS